MEWLPSILAADPLKLSAGLDKVVDRSLRSIHLDIMDGHFVPNISFGPSVVKAVKMRNPDLFRDVHLMLDQPEKFITKFIESGAQRIFIHCEISKDSFLKSLNLLEDSSIEWGLAINPDTPVDFLAQHRQWVEKMNRLLMMSVFPGFSGQSFIESTFERVKDVRKFFPDLEICVDGGVNETIANQLSELGISHFVVGSNFFKDC